MSVNKHRPHVYVVPEDDANRQIANGFLLHHTVVPGQVRVLPPAGGWAKALTALETEYLRWLEESALCHLVLLVDFDGSYSVRRARFDAATPEDLRSRVFVLGPRETPEALKRALNNDYENIGKTLAAECHSGGSDTWGHEHLRHNEVDRARLASVASLVLRQL